MSAAHSAHAVWPASTSQMEPRPSADGARYPAAAIATMPGPRGRPLEMVWPDVSECSRTALRRRPVSSATIACPASCTSVTTCREKCQTGGINASAAPPRAAVRASLSTAPWCRTGSNPQVVRHVSTNVSVIVATLTAWIS